MEMTTVKVRDKNKARTLIDLLRALDFVASVDIASEEKHVDDDAGDAREEAFFAAAGMWAGRDVTQDILRATAWPRQSS